MKISIDTEKIMNNIKNNFETMSSYVNKTIKKPGKEESKLELLETELEFVKLVLDWNKKRVNAGKSVFFPKKLSKNAYMILKAEIRKYKYAEEKGEKIDG